METLKDLIDELGVLREKILSKIPSDLVLFDETILENEEWSDDDTINDEYHELPQIVIHSIEEYETPIYGRLLSINDNMVKAHNSYENYFGEQYIKALSTDELANLLAMLL
jgi:hypothetical protein